ncbi:MAG: lysine transporter LysE [Campylobacteraceae bacterium 4484_166]|nr:MAG: lysine transporter LysE [Campylobacteraceae bacterium 4484_166]
MSMLFSIALFALATVLTPGPNNLMLLSSGLNFGFKRSLPHMAGIAFGFPFMVICVGLGIGVVFELFPFVYNILKIIGISYLFWMAWQIATNDNSINQEKYKKSKPFTFMQSVLFQWVNPKAWIMAITSTATFTTSDENTFLQVFVIAFIYMLSGFLSTSSWTIGGVVLKKIIKDAKSLKIFNITMAVLIVASILPFIFEI